MIHASNISFSGGIREGVSLLLFSNNRMLLYFVHQKIICFCTLYITQIIQISHPHSTGGLSRRCWPAASPSGMGTVVEDPPVVSEQSWKDCWCHSPLHPGYFHEQCSSKANSIVKDPTRPSHSLFQFLPSGRRYQSMRARAPPECSTALSSKLLEPWTRINLPPCKTPYQPPETQTISSPTNTEKLYVTLCFLGGYNSLL